MNIRELSAAMGRKRFVALLVLLGLNGVLGSVWYYWQIPQRDMAVAEKNTVDGERLKLLKDIEELPKRYEEMKKTEARYEQIIARGFIGDQDRIKARQKLDVLRTQVGLRGITYSISPQDKVDTSRNFSALTHSLVASKLAIKFETLTDLEVRDFIERLRNEYGGLILLTNLKFAHDVDITTENLAELSLKKPVDYVDGEANFEWYSLVEKTADPKASQTQAFGGTSR